MFSSNITYLENFKDKHFSGSVENNDYIDSLCLVFKCSFMEREKKAK